MADDACVSEAAELPEVVDVAKASDCIESSPVEKKFLHIGCGMSGPERLPTVFRSPEWQEIRLDIDPAVRPDIVASVTDLSAVQEGSVDAVWSSHNLEHLEAHEVPIALREIYRVLKDDGFVLITLPDLQAVARLVAAGRLTETAYQSPMGPITALDMLYGHGASLAAGNRYMAHRSGFDTQYLGESLLAAGFQEVRVRSGSCYDLWACAFKVAQ